jgi:1,4-dihydroxy-6-naphthoate synthase
VGTSVGRGYGPRLVAREPRPLASLEGTRVALPGPRTTATLVARGLLPPFAEVHLPFTAIVDAVRSGAVAAGVIIHEGQLTWQADGLVLLADLGERFGARHGGLPLPLGVNCVRRDLGSALRSRVADAYRRSVEIALSQREAAVAYALRFGRGLSRELADEFVGMYVNEDSLALRDDLRQAVAVLEREYAAVAEPGTPREVG